MIRHIVIAAWRNMAANKLISAIAILGLAVGIAVALLAALVVRSQFTFDHFIPGYERTYAVTSAITVPGYKTSFNTLTTADTAAIFRFNMPGIENITRLMPSNLTATNPAADGTNPLQRGAVAGREGLYWADANLESVLPLPVFRGDPRAALARPDGIVLSRSIARKYFGRDDVVGRQILLNRHPMTVGAVIEDLPSDQTELEYGIFASALASFSGFAVTDKPGNFNTNVHTYLRLKPGTALTAVESALPDLVNRLAVSRGIGNDHFPYVMSLKAIDRLNLDADLNPGAWARLEVEGFVGLLILFIAAVNFVNLLTARAARRAREVGVRKVCGADRPHLMAQFLGEAILAVTLSACLAAALSEWMLPVLNAFLRTEAGFDYGRRPELLPALLVGIILLGLAAGAWPAMVLSAFRPTRTLKGAMDNADGAGTVRNVLTGLQFAILIVLAIATIVVWQQRRYATEQVLRADTDRMLIVQNANCTAALRSEIRKLAGVESAACSDGNLLDNGRMTGVAQRGTPMQIDLITLDWGVFPLYGIRPLAGALPDTNPPGDSDSTGLSRVVINALAARRLGFASPQAAVGQRISITQTGLAPSGIIAAVVPDFAFYSVERALEPTIYGPMREEPTPQQLMSHLDKNGDGFIEQSEFPQGQSTVLMEADANRDGRIDLDELTALIASSGDDMINIRLRGQAIPETLTAIDRLWSATGNSRPINRFFLDAHMQELYLDMVRQGELLGAFSGIAVLLACLGLFGIAVSTAERRTKEIGVRKAMGAGDGQIVALLLWQFAQPVLWANVIAWPVAWWLMRRWLAGFAYHVDLHWWVFAGASVGALLIALLTVAGQAFLTARQKPVLALRYE